MKSRRSTGLVQNMTAGSVLPDRIRLPARIATVAFLAAAVAACGGGGGGGGSFCVGSFEGGSTEWGCNNCSGIDPFTAGEFDVAIDNNSGTYKAFGLGTDGQMQIRAMAPEGMTFPGGVDAGALMRFPAGTYPSISVTITAYRNGAAVGQTAGSYTGTAGNVPGAGQDTFYAVEPALEFDRLDTLVKVNGNAETVVFRVYEFCGDR